jgi:hypothetical protein
MKRPQFHWPKIDVRSLGFQTAIEIAAGGLLMAILLRWIFSEA